jgi:hypothetical protein
MMETKGLKTELGERNRGRWEEGVERRLCRGSFVSGTFVHFTYMIYLNTVVLSNTVVWRFSKLSCFVFD